jgi:hypothetical protein
MVQNRKEYFNEKNFNLFHKKKFYIESSFSSIDKLSNHRINLTKDQIPDKLKIIDLYFDFMVENNHVIDENALKYINENLQKRKLDSKENVKNKKKKN